MNKLSKLASLCKCSVSIGINDHKNYYENIEEYLLKSEHDKIEDFLTENQVGRDIYDKMVELDSLVIISAYDKTPVGSFCVYHYNIDLAIDKMINILKQEMNNKLSSP